MKKIEEIRENFTKADQMTRQAEADLKKLKTFVKDFKKIEANLKALTDYYQADWLEDVEQWYAQTSDENYYSAGQDAIWNAAQDLHEGKIALLKLIAKSL
ncbi:MAG: DUF4298 domain-containing protein [Capnocytophaga sp.]|nr:DUF4298 domain-containing protein [Capnocytophaga sp.]